MKVGCTVEQSCISVRCVYCACPSSATF